MQSEKEKRQREIAKSERNAYAALDSSSKREVGDRDPLRQPGTILAVFTLPGYMDRGIAMNERKLSKKLVAHDGCINDRYGGLIRISLT